MKKLLLVPCLLISALAFAAPNPAYVPLEADSVVVLDHLDQPAPQLDVLSRLLGQNCATLKPSFCSEPLKALLGYHTEQGQRRLKAKSLTAAWTITEQKKDFDLFLVVEQPAIDLATFVETVKKALAEQDACAFTLEQQGDWWVLKKLDTAEGVDVFLGFRAIPDGLFFASSTDEAFAKKVGAGEVPSIVGSESPLLEAFAPPPEEAVGPVFHMKATPPPEDALDLGNPTWTRLVAQIQSITSLACATKSDLFLTTALQMVDEAAARELAENMASLQFFLLWASRTYGNYAPDSPSLALLAAFRINIEGAQTLLTFRAPLSTLEKAAKETEARAKKASNPAPQD